MVQTGYAYASPSGSADAIAGSSATATRQKFTTFKLDGAVDPKPIKNSFNMTQTFCLLPIVQMYGNVVDIS
jgi:hypothetical protein